VDEARSSVRCRCRAPVGAAPLDALNASQQTAMTARLHLLCCTSTSSISTVAFAKNERLDRCGREALSKFAQCLPFCETGLRILALCAAQTAEGFAFGARVEPLLRCDFGRWAGRTLSEVQVGAADGVADWLKDLCAAPHGSESFAEALTRISGWMDGLRSTGGSLLAISHPSVIRAAIAHTLGAGPAAFRHIEVAPLTRAKLSGAGGRWTLFPRGH
jgi:hypothetical protein